MKYLSGAELVGYIKERQAKQVRRLRQADGVYPRLAIVQTADDPVIHTYVNLKKQYGEDILIDVDHVMTDSDSILSEIERLNNDTSVHAIIVQLPLADPERTDEILKTVAPEKDVDGLSGAALFDPATALAINWLCAGYNIDLSSHSILIVGKGRLVGAPLATMWRNSGLEVTAVSKSDGVDLAKACRDATLIVSGAGVPGLITSDMVRPDTVVIDAGTASDSGKIVGDFADDVYEREDIKITPKKGGVGPLTVAALFDNVIRAAERTTQA
jgi:methylenetetrahydrofolate dehydrogenase (NADP+)/methenyltetrahydrofolate cyclohydrolase